MIGKREFLTRVIFCFFVKQIKKYPGGEKLPTSKPYKSHPRKDNAVLFEDDSSMANRKGKDSGENLASTVCPFKPNWQCQKAETMEELGLFDGKVHDRLTFCLVCTLNNIDYTLYKAR